MATSHNIAIKGAILSYPNIYTPELFEGEPTDNPQHSAVLLFDSQEKYDELVAAGLAAGIEEFGSEKKLPRGYPEKTERFCIKEITLTEENDGVDFDGWAIKVKGGSTGPKENRRPKRINTIDRANTQVVEEDGSEEGNGIFYPGCKVDAIVSMWTSTKYKHCRANIMLIRFVEDGTRLGNGGGASMTEMLDQLGDVDAEADI